MIRTREGEELALTDREPFIRIFLRLSPALNAYSLPSPMRPWRCRARLQMQQRHSPRCRRSTVDGNACSKTRRSQVAEAFILDVFMACMHAAGGHKAGALCLGGGDIVGCGLVFMTAWGSYFEHYSILEYAY